MSTRTLLSSTAAALLLAGLVAGTSACASTSRFDGPDGDRRLYQARCGFCHVPFAPADFHPDDWPVLVADMSARSGLSPAYRERVTRWVVAESRRTWDRP